MRTQGSFDIHSQHTESEGYDRSSLELPGMQETFVRLLARLTSTPLIVVLVHGALPRAAFSKFQRPGQCILSAACYQVLKSRFPWCQSAPRARVR